MDFSYLFNHPDDLVRTLAYVNAGLVAGMVASWAIFGYVLKQVWSYHVWTVDKFTDIMIAAKAFMDRVGVHHDEGHH